MISLKMNVLDTLGALPQTKVSRRQLASSLAAVATLRGQNPSPENDLASARDQIRQNSEALAKVKIAIETEPAVHFKV